jgi:hypothetical protein
MLNPRAFRWTALAERWAAQGHHVDVVCAWVPPLSRAEIRNGVSVLRVGGTFSERLRRVLHTGRSHANIEAARTTVLAERPRAGRIRRLLHWIHDRTWKKLYWPDYACLWRWPAASTAGRLIVQHNHDLLISVSDPFTSHLVGRAVKARRPAIPWIVDIGDPFSFRHDAPTNNYALYARRNRKAERTLFARADVVTVTCEGAAKAYARLYGECASKLKVIPPLLPPRVSMRAGERLFKDDGAYRLLFVGTLYSKFRNPAFLLSLFARLREVSARKLQLHFVGSINDCAECFQPYRDLMGQAVVLHGLRNRDYVSHAIDEADLLINIANSNSFQLPSKLVEYVQSEKPILNITRFPDDAATEFLHTYPRLLNLEECERGSSAQQVLILKEFVENTRRISDRAALQRWLEPFTIEKVASAYIESLPRPAGESACSPS